MTLSKQAEDALLAVANGNERFAKPPDAREQLQRRGLLTITFGAGDTITPAGLILASYIRREREREHMATCAGCQSCYPPVPPTEAHSVSPSGEPERPAYVPPNVPWAYVTDGLGRKVGAWVETFRGRVSVRVYDEDDAPDPFIFTSAEQYGEFLNRGANTEVLRDQCAALLRGEIGWGHKKDSDPNTSGLHDGMQSAPSADATPALGDDDGIHHGNSRAEAPKNGTVSDEDHQRERAEDQDTGRNAAGSALSAGPSGHEVTFHGVCRVCGAKWDRLSDGSWKLVGNTVPGKCCDNAPNFPDTISQDVDSLLAHELCYAPAPSDELEEDELRALAANYKPECHWRGMPGRSCPSPLCPVHSERAVSAAEQNARDPMRCPACGMKGGTANTLCHEGLHSPRALAYFEKHCSQKEPSSPSGETSETAAPSPPAGPAKVFGREPSRTDNVSSDEATHELDIGALVLSWFEDGKVYIDTRDDWHDGEALALSILAALLTYATPEQVVGAMGEETKEQVFDALVDIIDPPRFEIMLSSARKQRDEALARVGELETALSAWVARHTEALARAEKAEAEVEAWKDASGLVTHGGRGDPDGVTPAAAQKFWELVEAERDQAIRERADRATSDGIDINELTKRAEQAERERDALVDRVRAALSPLLNLEHK